MADTVSPPPGTARPDLLLLDAATFDALITQPSGTVNNRKFVELKTWQQAIADVAGLIPRGEWVAPTDYYLRDLVKQGGIVYVCLEGHTSGTFADDLAAGRWTIYQGVALSELSGDSGAGLVAWLTGGVKKTVGAWIDEILVGLGQRIKQIDTYADAASHVSTSGRIVYVAGRSVAGDGGGGSNWLDTKGTVGRPAANGGTILHTSDGWLRRVVGDAYLTSWFGVDNTATQAAIDAAYGGIAAVLINTHQTWTAPVTVKNGIKLRGLGVDIMGGGGTKITYTGSTDALVIANPVNGSTSANIDIEGIWFSSNSLANNCGMIFDTASSVLKIRKCRFNSKIGIILDQTEISDIYDCSFAYGDGPENIGVWLVNGADKNVGALPFFTNRISVKGCEFNGGSGSVCIRDDGGVSHVFEDNNYNSSGYHIIATAVNSLRITGGEYEENSEASIVIGLTKKNGGAGAKSNVVSITDTFYYNSANKPFVSSVSGAIGHLDVVNNHINSPGVVFSGLAVACDSVRAEGNRQVGAGDGNTLINNYYDQVVATTAWGASGTAPNIGNGTLAAVKSRKGRDVTYRLSLLFGSTTTPGTGEWSFGLPHSANTLAASFSVGSVAAVISGTSGYSMAASLSSDGTIMRINPTSTTPNAGAGVPATWTTGSYLHAQISYEAAALI